MVNAQVISKKALSVLQRTGLIGSLVDPNATYSTSSGGVTEAPVSFAVWCSPLTDESRRWQNTAITATIYVSAYNVPTVPQPGWRIIHDGRTFAIVAVFPYSIHDTTISWRLDVGEVATS